MAKDCKQPLRIGRIRALNGCAGRLAFAVYHTCNLPLIIHVLRFIAQTALSVNSDMLLWILPFEL